MNIRILFDFNNLAHRCLHLQDFRNENSWNLLTHMMFTQAYEFCDGVYSELDPDDTIEVIFALDSHDGYWRRDMYAPYKADRAKKREKSDIDWTKAYSVFEKFTCDIRRLTPWKVICVTKCEADDIIYALTKDTEDPCIIHSGDSDYLQLVSDRISLWIPHAKEYAEFPRRCKIAGGAFVCDSPETYLKYAVLTGQGGKDNVYNVKTPKDWDETSGKRKPGFGVAAARKVIELDDNIEIAAEKAGISRLNFLRNQILIDMRNLPDMWRKVILSVYDQYKIPDVKDCSIAKLAAENKWNHIGQNADMIETRMLMMAGLISGDSGVTTPVFAEEEDVMDFSI